jgi:hypothetical protein
VAKVPKIVGKSEAAALLKVHPNNLRVGGEWRYGLPATLQERGIADVGATPCWYRSEILKAAKARNGSKV